MADTDDTAAWLQETDTIEATILADGTEYPIEVEDITRDEALEARSEGSTEAEDEAIRYAIQEYLVAPDVDTGSHAEVQE